ncbi:MAG: hypothetical protein KDD52_03110 [Bdellovibrionales bacterium]|nr:hypothetical protein [Bdellovibrionales bacterium]
MGLSSTVTLTKLETLDYNIEKISRCDLDIANKERSNLLPWKGQFSPQLVESLLENYSSVGDVVLDPFMGSGTVLYECSLRGLNSLGVELNPAAVKMAQIYLLSLRSKRKRAQLLNYLDSIVIPIVGDEFDDFKLSYEKPSEINPLKLFDQFIDCFSEKLDTEHKLILETYLVLLDPNEKELSRKRAWNLWERLKKLVLNLPETKSKMQIFNGDCRLIPFEDNAVDIVITSPPYINVFNYHQQKRTSVEALGFDILSVAKTEIGSNRKYRGNRYLTVVEYCLDIFMVFKELHRVCKEGAKIIFVVGRESNVRKTSFYNSEIIATLAQQSLGLFVSGRHERSFKNRFGKIIKEDVLIIENPNKLLENGIDPRDVAYTVLHEGLKRAPKESQEDLAKALFEIQKVRPSPPYESSGVYPHFSKPKGR